MLSKNIMTSKDSILRYNHPVVIATRTKHGVQRAPDLSVKPPVGDQGFVIPMTDKVISTEEALNIIFPPREWEEDGKLWRQMISTEPVPHEGIKRLDDQLEARLKDQEAKEDGIGEIRARLIGQFFDELIRLETVICGERGLLLGRIRDEMKYTMSLYRKLYESCMGFALRKSLLAVKKGVDEQQCYEELENTHEELNREIEKTAKRIEEVNREAAEHRAAEHKKHEEAMAFLAEINAQMKAQLKSVIKPRKQKQIQEYEERKRKSERLAKGLKEEEG